MRAQDMFNDMVADGLEDEKPKPSLGSLATKQPKEGTTIKMSGPAPRKPGERWRVGDRHPVRKELEWDGAKWVESTGIGTRPMGSGRKAKAQ